MCPTLSRPDYFLNVINTLHEFEAAPGSLEERQQSLLLDLARSVEGGTGLTDALLQRVNELFEQYSAIRLQARFVPGHEGKRGVLLQAVFADGRDEPKRIYMEAMISMLETMERRLLELQTCIQCDNWFIPYERAGVAKFCSTKCRNRYHYLLKKHG